MIRTQPERAFRRAHRRLRRLRAIASSLVLVVALLLAPSSTWFAQAAPPVSGHTGGGGGGNGNGAGGGSQAPTATFTWALPKRLPVGSDGVPIESLDTSHTDVLDLNGCGSSSGNPLEPLTSFDWTISGPFPAWHPASSCHVGVSRPLTSPWTEWAVTLTVTRSDGKQATTTQTVRFRDLLIASLGDSAASGEGEPNSAPPDPTNPHLVDPSPRPVRWAEGADAARCDRSGRAASVQAALQIENSDPGTSVTFWHLACSGAAIVGPVDCSNPTRFLGIVIIPRECPGDPGTGGLLYPYDGQNKPPGAVCRNPTQVLFHCDHLPLPPQIDTLADLINRAGRSPDALLITAGADDINWTSVIFQCYDDKALCETANKQFIADGLGALPGRLKQLAARLLDLNIAPDRVFLTEYWDPTVDDGFGGPSSSGPGFSSGCARDPIAPSAANRKWGHDQIVVPMNLIERNAAQSEGWKWVGGIADAFQGHGLCSHYYNSWIVSRDESNRHEDTNNGAWHANQAGQRVIMQHLLSTMMPVLNSSAGELVNTATGSLVGSHGGSFVYYQLSYLTSAPLVFSFSYTPFDAGQANAIGVVVYQDGNKLGSATGASAVSLAVTPSESGGPMLIQVFNYSNYTVAYTLTVQQGSHLLGCRLIDFNWICR